MVERLPKCNGLLFFDSQARPVFQVYTDACLEELGGFFYSGSELFWDQTTPALEQSRAFIASVQDSTQINVHELEALLVASHTWTSNWQQSVEK